MATDIIDLSTSGTRFRPDDLLGRVALALGSTLELDEVLRLLAETGREATGAHRCSVFLLEGRRLIPAVAIGVHPDGALWDAFQEMGPIELDARRWDFICAGRIAVYESAGDTAGFVPREWVERFAVGALAVVPLTSRGEPCGLMALDWEHPSPVLLDDMALLEAIATYAGVAVTNARLYESARRRTNLQTALVDAAAALSPVLDREELADRLAAAYVELVDARLCGVGLFDADRRRVTTMGVRGHDEGEPALPVSVAFDKIPGHLVSLVREEWEREKRPLELRDEPFFDGVLGGRVCGASWYLLLPLVVEDRTRGVVVLGFEERRRLGSRERAAIDALANLAAVAVARRVLLDRLASRYRQLDTLFQVTVALTGGADAGALIDELNRLLTDQGIVVRGIALRDRRLARSLGGAEPVQAERDAWRGGRWQPGNGWLELEEGEYAVPMHLGRRLVGTLRVVGAPADSEDRVFVEALARGLAEVADRDALRASVEEAARERAVAAERERMAVDLHDTAGTALVAVGLAARHHAEELPAGSPTRGLVLRLAGLADRGKWEIDQAVRALAFVPAAKGGLSASIRALARSFSADSAIEVSVETRGRVTRLPAAVERALYRVAHEALVNAWRHARCRVIHVELIVGPAEVTLRVTDDGVGIGDCLPEESVGMTGMRRAMRGVHGELRVANDGRGGTVVEARVARGR